MDSHFRLSPPAVFVALPNMNKMSRFESHLVADCRCMGPRDASGPWGDIHCSSGAENASAMMPCRA
jgi:hypothetical protein